MKRLGMRAVAAASLMGLLTGCATTGAEADPALEYVAHFNEPFLTFTTDGPSLTLVAPGRPNGMSTAISRQPIDDGVQFDGELDSTAPESRFRLTVRRERCQDDMAGVYFSHSARFERGETLELRPQQGCARLSTEPQPRE